MSCFGAFVPFHMNDKHLQAFALAYLIGWLLSRMPKKSKH